MLQYARSDTHFLLFIYDHLRNALIDRTIAPSSSNGPVICTPPSTANVSTNPSHALINHVLAKSAETCLRVYTKEPYDRLSGSGPHGWDTLAKKWNKPFLTANSNFSSSTMDVQQQQKSVYQAVHEWREMVAREEDESTRYVMPNPYLFKIAQAPFPRDVSDLMRILGVQPPPPVVVKRRVNELFEVMRQVVVLELEREEWRVDDHDGKDGIPSSNEILWGHFLFLLDRVNEAQVGYRYDDDRHQPINIVAFREKRVY